MNLPPLPLNLTIAYSTVSNENDPEPSPLIPIRDGLENLRRIRSVLIVLGQMFRAMRTVGALQAFPLYTNYLRTLIALACDMFHGRPRHDIETREQRSLYRTLGLAADEYLGGRDASSVNETLVNIEDTGDFFLTAVVHGRSEAPFIYSMPDSGFALIPYDHYRSLDATYTFLRDSISETYVVNGLGGASTGLLRTLVHIIEEHRDYLNTLSTTILHEEPNSNGLLRELGVTSDEVRWEFYSFSSHDFMPRYEGTRLVANDRLREEARTLLNEKLTWETTIDMLEEPEVSSERPEEDDEEEGTVTREMAEAAEMMFRTSRFSTRRDSDSWGDGSADFVMPEPEQIEQAELEVPRIELPVTIEEEDQTPFLQRKRTRLRLESDENDSCKKACQMCRAKHCDDCSECHYDQSEN